MKKSPLFLSIAIGLAGALPAHAGAPPKPPEASIPFVNMGSVHDWRADGDSALYIQDLQRRWYHATLMGPCTDLPFVDAIGIETRGVDTLDRFGTIIVRGHRCAIRNFVASAPPPKKVRKKG